MILAAAHFRNDKYSQLVNKYKKKGIKKSRNKKIKQTLSFLSNNRYVCFTFLCTRLRFFSVPIWHASSQTKSKRK